MVLPGNTWAPFAFFFDVSLLVFLCTVQKQYEEESTQLETKKAVLEMKLETLRDETQTLAAEKKIDLGSPGGYFWFTLASRGREGGCKSGTSVT
jgi:hypothetical protein